MKQFDEATICEKESASRAEKLFILNIRLGGLMSYVQVKMIDVTWDLIIGQGARFLQVWVMYKAAGDALIWTMERAPVPSTYLQH